MITRSERRHWFRVAAQIQGSVVFAILPRVLICGSFGLVVSYLDYLGWPVQWYSNRTLIPDVVIGLLLVFRTNTAYDRFWEGRRQWGEINNTIRNLARHIWLSVPEKVPTDRAEKVAALQLLIAFAITTKLHLRAEGVDNSLRQLLNPAQYGDLAQVRTMPLVVAFWIGEYLQQQFHHHGLHVYQLQAMQKLLDILVNCLGSCERILRTPIPLAYAIHLRQLLLVYCLFLPFQIVNSVHWATGIICGLVSFILLGIEEIGIQIENPFGHDSNDIPLDLICAGIAQNIQDLIQISPAAIAGTDGKFSAPSD